MNASLATVYSHEQRKANHAVHTVEEAFFHNPVQEEARDGKQLVIRRVDDLILIEAFGRNRCLGEQAKELFKGERDAAERFLATLF